MIVAIGEAKDVGESLLGDGGVGGHRRHNRQAAVGVDFLAREHNAAVHVADDREHARIVAKRLCRGLSLLRVRLIVDHLGRDLAARYTACRVALLDGKIDRLAHFYAERRRRGRQRAGDADENVLAS